jgi:hypothetical protein
VIVVKNGELSNQVSSVFGIRCDGFLVEFREDGVKDRIMNTLRGKLARAVVNEKALTFMDRIYRRTEYTIDLVVDKSEYTDQMKRFIQDFPYNRVVLIESPAQITSRLMVGDLTYYIDRPDRLSVVNSEFALSLQDVAKLLKFTR